MQENFLQKRLDKRKELHSLRTLKVQTGLVDFCSNDYLGFAGSGELLAMIEQFPVPPQQSRLGSTGSRLLSGNSAFVEELEKFIASFHFAQAGLIFNSGYDANVGFFSSVPGRGDVVIYDDLIHASVHDGMRLGKAEMISFKHNDFLDLKSKLEKTRSSEPRHKEIFVVVESLYSMDGDIAPLNDIVVVCEEFGANLIVDEAHATGVLGNEGKGLVNELKLEDKIFARLHTFGKALGTHGAIILGSETLRNYLINFARSFIYTTALPYHALVSIRCAYELLPKANRQRELLFGLIDFFNSEITPLKKTGIAKGRSPIQSIVIPKNEKVKMVAEDLQKKRLDVRPILSPTVPRESERLRICLHAFNTEEEIRQLVQTLIPHEALFLKS